MEFGKLVKKIRMEKGITQLELGKMIGLSEGTMSKIENGIRTPDIPLIEKLAPALGVPYSRLFFYENETDLTEEEFLIIKHYRNDPNFKAGIDSLVVAFGLKKDSTDTSSVRA